MQNLQLSSSQTTVSLFPLLSISLIKFHNIVADDQNTLNFLEHRLTNTSSAHSLGATFLYSTLYPRLALKIIHLQQDSKDEAIR